MPFSELLEELYELIAEDALYFESTAEVENAREMVASASSSGRQRAVFEATLADTNDKDQALRAMVQHLIEEYHADL